MSEESGQHGQRPRRPDPTLGRRLSSRPQFLPVRPDGQRGLHRRGSDSEQQAQPAQPERTRVVLADPKRAGNSMRPRVELEENSSWGAGMVDDLARKQLRSALLVAGVVVALLGSLPLAYYFSPSFASLSVLGIPLAWLLLGVVPFPLMFLAGLWYNRTADRNEREFVQLIDG